MFSVNGGGDEEDESEAMETDAADEASRQPLIDEDGFQMVPPRRKKK
jgi:hypothetical protein